MNRGGWIVVEEGVHVELERAVLLPGHGDHDDDHHDVDHDHDNHGKHMKIERIVLLPGQGDDDDNSYDDIDQDKYVKLKHVGLLPVLGNIGESESDEEGPVHEIG